MSRLGMQLFRALRANVGITCVDVTLRNVYTMLHRLREAATNHPTDRFSDA